MPQRSVKSRSFRSTVAVVAATSLCLSTPTPPAQAQTPLDPFSQTIEIGGQKIPLVAAVLGALAALGVLGGVIYGLTQIGKGPAPEPAPKPGPAPADSGDESETSTTSTPAATPAKPSTKAPAQPTSKAPAPPTSTSTVPVRPTTQASTSNQAPAPKPANLNDVVPDLTFRKFLNTNYFFRAANPTAPISAQEMASLPDMVVERSSWIAEPRDLQDADLEGLQYAVNVTAIDAPLVTRIPDVSNFARLESLRLDAYRGTEIPGTGTFPALKSVDLSGEFTSLPAGLGGGGKVETFKLGASPVAALPDSIGTRALRSLDLYNVPNLVTLPATLKQATSLMEFELEGAASLTALPDGFLNSAELENLKILDVPKLRALPDSIGGATALEELDIKASGLTTLPDTFGDMRSLKRISLIDVSSLTALPNTFGQLENLHTLSITGAASLTTLPASFGDLNELWWLTLEGCQRLNTVPASFGKLENLETLDISGSRVHEAITPAMATQLVNLESVTMQNLRINALPKWLLSLPSLARVSTLHGNSIPEDDPVRIALDGRAYLM